jgi:hypothetical protein
MKRIYSLSLALTLVLTLGATQAFAWGQLGHYLIGLMAEKQLKKSTLKKVEGLLYPVSLSKSGTWMDDIRSDKSYDYATTWHYLNSKNGEYDPSTQEKTGDAYEAIQRIKAELKKGGLDQKTEAEKLEEDRISKMNAALSAYGDLLNKNDGFLSDYNEKEAHLNFLLSHKVITQSQYNEVFAELLKRQPIVAEYLAKEFEYRENIRNSLIEEIKLRDILMFDTLEQSDKLTKELAEESEELQYQASLLGLTATERQKVIKLKQVEVKLNQELKAANAVQDETARLELITAAYQRHSQRISNINKEISIC